MIHLAHPHDAEGGSRAAIRVAARQHGRISVRQLHWLGLSDAMVAARVAAGWLVREHRGVYRLAGVPPTPAGASAAALLATGDRAAAITHRTGLEHHQVLDPAAGGPVHVTSARNLHSRRGIVVHRAALARSEVTRIDGLRVATLTRCLIDAAAVEPEAVIAEAVREAEFRRTIDHAAVAAAAEGRPGAALLRRLAAERLPVRGQLRSDFELRFARFLRDRGFPPADVNHAVILRRPTRKVILDVVWWEAGLAVELDSRQAHLLTRAFEADRERDRRLAVQFGLQVVRVTWRQLHDGPDALDTDLRTLHARGVASRAA